MKSVAWILGLVAGALAVGRADTGYAGDGRGAAGPDRPIHERLDLPSVAACGGCHQEVFREWSASLHGRAWTNANVRQATNEFEKKSCRPCHSPRPVFETGLERRPAYRDFNQEDGVHCLSCHGLPDGVAASRTIEGAPCRPREDPRLASAELCYPCHQPTHQAFDEYRTSKAFAEGKRCADCHMPERADGGRSHGPHGGFDPEFVRSGLDWDVEARAGELRVTLTNRTGHKFPGEISSRSLLVRVEAPGTERRTTVLRRPHKGEDRIDDRLSPDETRTLVFALPDDASDGGDTPVEGQAGRTRVQILFRPLPLAPDEECILVGEWSR